MFNNNIIVRFVYIALAHRREITTTTTKLQLTIVTMTGESKQAKVNLHTCVSPNTRFHFHSIKSMLMMTFSNKNIITLILGLFG